MGGLFCAIQKLQNKKLQMRTYRARLVMVSLPVLASLLGVVGGHETGVVCNTRVQGQ